MWKDTNTLRSRGFVLAIVIPFTVVIFGLAFVFLYMSMNTKLRIAANSARSETYHRQQDAARAAAQGLAKQSLSSALFSIVAAGENASTRLDDAGAVAEAGAVNGNFARSGSGTATFTTLAGAVADPATDLLNALGQSYSSVLLPSTRFAVRPPGSYSIAKTFTYRLVTAYSQRDNVSGTVISSTSSTQLTQTITIYEVPGQFAVDAGDIVLTRSVSGSVLGRNVTLQADVGGIVAAQSSLDWRDGVKVNNLALPNRTNSTSGFIEQFGNTAGLGFANQVSLLAAQGSVQWIPLGDRSIDGEGIPSLCKSPSSTTDWDVYTHPYFQTSTRIRGAAPLNRLSPPSFSSVPCYASVGNGSAAQRKSESGTIAAFGTLSSVVNGYLPASGNAVLVTIDVSQIPVVNGSQTLFVDLQSDYSPAPRKSVIIGLKNADVLLHPFAIVSANPVLFLGNFNSGGRPAAVIAPAVLNSLSATPPAVVFSGQRGSIQKSSSFNPFFVQSGASVTTGTAITLLDTDGSNASNLPPVTLKNWLVVLGAPQ